MVIPTSITQFSGFHQEYGMNRFVLNILFPYMLLIVGCHPNLSTIKQNSILSDTLPVISPDFIGITIPPNIAPLHFRLKDCQESCVAEISSVNGGTIVVWGKKGNFNVSLSAWRDLLLKNFGKSLSITIYNKTNKGQWLKFVTIKNRIASDPIDNYCTYRLLNYQYNYSSDLRECQRNLTSFDEKMLVNSQNFAWGCVNCHTPLSNDPSRFVLQVRSNSYGSETLISNGTSLETLSSRFGYTAWHPTAELIAFTTYKVEQYFHAIGNQFIDVYDEYSDIVIYNTKTRKTVPLPLLSRKETLETWPAWSPDGQYLYFCSSPVLWTDNNQQPPENFNQTKYSLLRISYNKKNDSWGEIDTMLCPGDTGLSIAQPKISPDNKFCLFTMQAHGAYPHSQVSSDLYLMELQTRQYKKLSINSEYNESWHSWSRNGRWILFSSKRGSGIFTHLYISYIDSTGNTHKPFILPQNDPEFYDSFTKCYNVAEFATRPVTFSERQLLQAVKIKHKTVVQMPGGSSLQSTGSTSQTWQNTPQFQ
jgi:hypothetical protein